MTIWLQMARSYNNPESVNYRIAYLRERMSKDLGYLDHADQVEMALLGNTIIQGGYLNTNLIRANSIIADHIAAGAITADKMTVDDLAAITAKFSGDVYVGGNLAVGGRGVLSALKFESIAGREMGNFYGWSYIGLDFFSGGVYGAGSAAVFVAIPANYEITKATLTLYAMPVYFEKSPAGQGSTGWKQSKRLRLYAGDGTDGRALIVADSGVSAVDWRGKTNITSATWGATSYSPALPYPGDAESSTRNPVQIKSGLVTGSLTPGKTTVFFVQTTDGFSGGSPDDLNNIGLGKLIVVVEGYAKP